MKKISVFVMAAAVALTALSGCKAGGDSSGDGRLSIVTSFYPMYDFAAKVAGEKAEVVNLVPAGMEPHSWEPEAADIVKLEEADVFVYNGAGMEHWTQDVLESLTNEDLIAVETSSGLTLLPGHHDEEEEQEDEKEHDHGEYDPHVWLAPENAKLQMKAICDALIQADPDNQDYYEQNYDKYAQAFDQLDEEYRSALSALPNKDIVVAHQAFAYLCQAYGLNQIAVEGLVPDSEPDPARMAEIIELAKDYQIKVIFFEETASSKVAQTIADALDGAKTDVLSPIGSLTDEQLANGDDYFSVMRQNLQALKNALQ